MSNLVYSTDGGRIQPQQAEPQRPQGEGIIRISRQTKGRKGKGVSIVSGFLMTEPELKLMAAQLKKVCGCGGSVKNGDIEIQGDKRNEIKAYLEKQGHTVKLAGG